MAIARTKLAKAKQQLAATDSDDNDLSATVDKLTKQHPDALVELETMDALAQQKAAKLGVGLTELRSDLALAKVTLIKAQKALQRAAQDGLADDSEQLHCAVTTASEQLDRLNATLLSIEG